MSKNEKRVTHEDVLKFFSDKDPALCPIPKEYRQKTNGYASVRFVIRELNGEEDLYRRGFKTQIVEFYKWLNENQHERENFLSLKYLPKDYDLMLLYGDRNFDQKWHFFIAYYAQREFYSQPECTIERKKMLLAPLNVNSDPLTDLKRLNNIELVMWLCNAAGVKSPIVGKYTLNPEANPEKIDKGDMKILAEEIIEKIRQSL